jgi:hypothetical protein
LLVVVSCRENTQRDKNRKRETSPTNNQALPFHGKEVDPKELSRLELMCPMGKEIEEQIVNKGQRVYVIFARKRGTS